MASVATSITHNICFFFFYNMTIIIISLHFLCSAQQLQPQELAILLRLKKHWRNPPLLDHWTPSNDSSIHCSWNEVACREGSVTQLNLGLKNLTGVVIPPFLFHLKNLTVLDLHGNTIQGNIPDNIVRLENLKRIKLSGNNFSGTLPSNLGRFSALETFEIFSNRFVGGLPKNLCFRGKLREVLAYDNELSGELHESIGRCGSLSVLRVSNNKFSGTLPEGLGGCDSNLSVLSVSKNNFSGRVPVGLGRCNRLLVLSLSENQFSGRIPEEVTWRASSLYLLLLNDNRFEGELPGELPWNLSRVEINNNRFSGEIPTSSSFWNNLVFFEARSNLLTGRVRVDTGLWKSLKRLDLSKNRMSGSIPEEIGSVSTLEQLDLSENQLSGEIPAQLGHLNLHFLNLSSNYLSGRIPSEFGNPIYATSFLNNSGLCMDEECSSRSRNNDILIISISVVLGISCLVVVIYAIVVRVYSRKREVVSNTTPTWKFTRFCVVDFTEVDILSGVTDVNLVGGGGSGKVYRIPVDSSGSVVAAKRIWNNFELGFRFEKEFHAEVGVLSKIRHDNIVTLLGCMSSENSKILIYEYLEKRSLDKWLHRKNQETDHGGINNVVTLDWHKRLKIAIGAAKGLCYMHHYCSPPIIHRDVKSSNILLDAEFNGKIADFGLAKLLVKPGEANSVSAVAGTFGYIAPEYAQTRRINKKSDVYSFGVVLLELTTGRVANDMNEDICLAEWARQHILSNKRIYDALDREIKDSGYTDKMCTVFKLGISCTSILPSDRPSMEVVLPNLLRFTHKVVHQVE